MDWINDARSIITLLSFVCFLAICLWAWSKRSRSEFDEAAMIPFRENDQPEADNKQH